MGMVKDQVIAERAELLARVFLTRREDVRVLPFGADNLAFFASIHSHKTTEVKGFCGFGVMVWGTEKALADDAEATKYMARKWMQLQKDAKGSTFYYFPVIILLFSMVNDTGYYAWPFEPSEEDERPKLLQHTELRAEKFDKRKLDHVVERVLSWYERFSQLIRIP
jgi:hypothetical protein